MKQKLLLIILILLCSIQGCENQIPQTARELAISTLCDFPADSGDNISIAIFDFAMQRVKEVLVDTNTPFSGFQERTWNGRNEAGYLVANGTYFIRIEIESEVKYISEKGYGVLSLL